jgi:hypothetical protein
MFSSWLKYQGQMVLRPFLRPCLVGHITITRTWTQVAAWNVIDRVGKARARFRVRHSPIQFHNTGPSYSLLQYRTRSECGKK